MIDSKSLNMKTLAWGEQNALAQVAWMTVFAVLTAIGAQIEIPHQPVPYTLQTLFVLLSGALLGKRNGALSQLFYLTAGLIGLPVFSSGGFGLAKILGPTGGYLLSFPIAAFVVGYLMENSTKITWLIVSMVVGLLIIFSLGTVQLYVVYYRDWGLAFVNGFLMFSWWDVVKVAAAVSTTYVLRKRYSVK
jgi:biotin transport system substrate-specific component